MDNSDNEKVEKPASRKTKKQKREDIILTKDNLLYQPLALAVNGYEATAFQQNVVIAVLRKLRGAIKGQRDGQFQKKPVQLSIFDNESVQKNYLRDGDLAFDIHLKELGVDTPHYYQAFKAVCTIADAKVWVPAKKADGKEMMIRKSFFEIGSENVVMVKDPQTGRITYKYKNRSPIFTVIMSKEVVNVLFPQDGRIYDFIDNTALMISEKFPKRIYLYLSNFKYMEGGLTVDYWKFRHDIGFNDNEIDPVTKEKIIQYPVFCDFEKRVLKPSVKTLREMSDNDISDFYFEYTAIKDTPRAKHPSKIHFDFFLSKVGQSIKDDKNATRETIEIESRLQEEFDQTMTQIRRIIISLTPQDYNPFTRKMDELKDIIENKKEPIKDKRAYCNKTFTDFIQTLIEDKKKHLKEDAAGASSHQTYQNEDESSNVVSETESSQFVRLFTEEDARKFAAIKEDLSSITGMEIWLPQIHLYQVEERTVTIIVPTKAFYEAFTHNFGSTLIDRVQRAFDREVGVAWEKK